MIEDNTSRMIRLQRNCNPHIRFVICGHPVLIMKSLITSARIRYLNQKASLNIKECYKLLNVSEDCDRAKLREAFLDLVKQYHPDSGSSRANAEKFDAIKEAYKLILINRNLETSKKVEDEEDTDDIKHKVPQHRHYLSYDGIGLGTPSQRQRQYQQQKVLRAIDSVLEHRTQKLARETESSMVLKDKQAAQKSKTRYGMERLVEDLIQESMSRGEFNNLPGRGKPLVYDDNNPFIDTTTHKLNQVLINNGFTPEWILLEKEIKSLASEIRADLRHQRVFLNPLSLTEKEAHQWNLVKEKLLPKVKELNKKILKYNIIVPILNMQKLLFNLEIESKKILKEKLDPSKNRHFGSIESCPKKQSIEGNPDSTSFFDIFMSIFK